MRTPSLVLLIICSLTLSGTAQEKFRVVHWDLEDGLSQGEVYKMLKDKNGFLWVGTSGGLCRFDGSRFRKYYHDPQKPGTINATATGGGLVEDSLHNIWIGTTNGLVRYDFQADTFAHFFPEGSEPFERHTFPFWATEEQIFSFEADSLIIAHDIHTLTRKKITAFAPSDSLSGSGASMSSAVIDRNTNSIWVLKGHGGSYGGSPGGGLIQIDMTTGQKKVYEWKCFKNIPRHHHGSEGMVFDRKRNCLWLNSWEGLMQFTLSDNQFHYVGALNPFFADKDYGHWVGISIDNQDRIWVAANPKGIVIYDPSDHSVKFPFPDDEKLQKDISDFNACLYTDKEGITWSGYWLRKGINQLLPFSPAFRHYTADNNNPYALGTPNVINTVPAGKGKIWIGSFHGIHLFDTRTELFTALLSKNLPGLNGEVLIPFAADTSASDQIYILDPRKGLYRAEVSKKLVQSIVFMDSLNHIIEIDYAKGISNYGSVGNGFMLTAYRGEQECVFRIQFGSHEAAQVFKLPIKTELRKSEFMSKDGLLFLRGQYGYSNLTYRVSTNNEWELIHSPLDSIPWSVAISNKMDQGIWVVVGKQLIHYDKDFRIVHSYSPEEGLPDVDIYSAIADEQGNIWFNTDRSIHVLNVETGIISTLSEKDGFEHQSYTNGPGLALGPGGDIYLGGGIFGVGLTRITPKKFTYTPASVYVQNLTINDETLPLSTGVNNLQELSLDHAQNQIAIETGIIDYYSQGKSHLRFKLNGFNDSWQYEPAYYTIRFDGLPPGDYTLLMQGSNAANQFVGPVKSLRILISPPWWNTWWAYVLFGGTIASAIWALVQYRSRALKQSNLALEQKVAERTNDLEKSLVDLRETQVQLIQSEKMASLGELTAGIAHEIQNPLNFVNNFSEVSNELLDEMKSELAQNHTDDAVTIANDVKQNLEKILHHGKRADAIVKGMLQHSRTSSGAKEPTDINTLIDEYLRLSYHGLRAKDKAFNAAMKTDFDPTLGTVNIVPQDMGRVVLNIINNAFYAVTEKKKRKANDQLIYEPLVTVRTKRLADNVLISIRDNGDGIPEKVLDKIFQPFFTTKPTGQGTGLGLSLSYDIVKAHGGEIRIETKTGEGSEFIIEIPI